MSQCVQLYGGHEWVHSATPGANYCRCLREYVQGNCDDELLTNKVIFIIVSKQQSKLFHLVLWTVVK